MFLGRAVLPHVTPLIITAHTTSCLCVNWSCSCSCGCNCHLLLGCLRWCCLCCLFATEHPRLEKLKDGVRADDPDVMLEWSKPRAQQQQLVTGLMESQVQPSQLRWLCLWAHHSTCQQVGRRMHACMGMFTVHQAPVPDPGTPH